MAASSRPYDSTEENNNDIYLSDEDNNDFPDASNNDVENNVTGVRPRSSKIYESMHESLDDPENPLLQIEEVEKIDTNNGIHIETASKAESVAELIEGWFSVGSAFMLATILLANTASPSFFEENKKILFQILNGLNILKCLAVIAQHTSNKTEHRPEKICGVDQLKLAIIMITTVMLAFAVNDPSVACNLFDAISVCNIFMAAAYKAFSTKSEIKQTVLEIATNASIIGTVETDFRNTQGIHTPIGKISASTSAALILAGAGLNIRKIRESTAAAIKKFGYFSNKEEKKLLLSLADDNSSETDRNNSNNPRKRSFS